MWHYYMFNRDTFLKHYHKRSNAETAFAMIKAKFGEVVRAKLPVAQVNEPDFSGTLLRPCWQGESANSAMEVLEMT